MDSTTAIKRMMEREGATPYRVAMDMHRAHSYVSGMIRRGSDPSTAVMADIAQACGYTLQLVGHGETLALDGTRRDAEGKE
ncbi:MAG: hypothetical protein MR611_04745 [Coriobacteriaceae bacterium]|nr:hypothetical protein [Coriobacteriaceae bacterium]